MIDPNVPPDIAKLLKADFSVSGTHWLEYFLKNLLNFFFLWPDHMVYWWEGKSLKWSLKKSNDKYDPNTLLGQNWGDQSQNSNS